MELACDPSIALGYVSGTQRARVISESWFAGNCYCLACDEESLTRSKPNTQATDFLCSSCGHRYELKTFLKRPQKSLVDGAYSALMSRINTHRAPTLCLLERDSVWRIHSLTAIHSSFLVPWVVEKRPPLGPNARRAGWVGCNLRLDRIPPDGEIELIAGGVAVARSEVRRKFQRYLPLNELSAGRRGWAALTLGIIRGLPGKQFALSDLYAKSAEFAVAYPGNRHVREKIRQQLQVLRDIGVIRFMGNGQYELAD